MVTIYDRMGCRITLVICGLFCQYITWKICVKRVSCVPRPPPSFPPCLDFVPCNAEKQESLVSFLSYWNKLCTWSPSQSTVCSSLDRCCVYPTVLKFLHSLKHCISWKRTISCSDYLWFMQAVFNPSCASCMTFHRQLMAWQSIWVRLGMLHCRVSLRMLPLKPLPSTLRINTFSSVFLVLKIVERALYWMLCWEIRKYVGKRCV